MRVPLTARTTTAVSSEGMRRYTCERGSGNDPKTDSVTLGNRSAAISARSFAATAASNGLKVSIARRPSTATALATPGAVTEGVISPG